MILTSGSRLFILLVSSCMITAPGRAASTNGTENAARSSNQLVPPSPSAALGARRFAGSGGARYFIVASPVAVPTSVPGDSLEAAFKSVRASPRELKFEPEVGTVTIGIGRTSVNGRVVYDAAADLSVLLATEDPGCPLDWRIQYSPLSLIGHLFSYEKVESGQMACGSPGSIARIRAIDLRTLGPASITDYFSESSVLEALRRDSWVRKKEQSQSTDSFARFLQELDDARTSAEMVATLSRQFAFDAAQFWRSFCVTGYDQATDLATVRLVATTNAGFGKTSYLQLGVMLRPTEAFGRVLAGLSESSGFLLGRFPNGLAKSTNRQPANKLDSQRRP